MYVLHPRLDSGGDRGGRRAHFSALVTGPGGEIISVDQWGRRRLAYPIDRNLEGYYVLSTFKCPGHVGRRSARGAAESFRGCAPAPAHSWHHSVRRAASGRACRPGAGAFEPSAPGRRSWPAPRWPAARGRCRRPRAMHRRKRQPHRHAAAPAAAEPAAAPPAEAPAAAPVAEAPTETAPAPSAPAAPATSE